MKIIIANGPGQINNGMEVILFPSRCDSAVPSKPFAYYPYELAYLSTLLKREMPEAEVKLIDGNYPGWTPRQYAYEISIHKPDVLITECSALTYETMTGIMQLVGAKTNILTGPYGMWKPEKARSDGWTHVIKGEYEAKVLAILQSKPEPQGFIDLDWLPFPEDQDISRIAYSEASDPMPGMIQVYPTRGCPLSCTFCVTPLYYGGHGHNRGNHRTRDIENVCDEIEYLARKYPTMSGCFFNEENHSANTDWLSAFAEALITKGLNRFIYDAMCGYWTFTEDLVKLLARAGYKQLRIGIESTSDKVGKRILKNVRVEKVEQFMRWCKAVNIRVFGTFMIGAPGSTEETDLETLRALEYWRLKGLLTRCQISTATPQPGTPFHREAMENGWLVSDDINRYDFCTPNLSYPDYPADRIRLVRGGR